VPDWFKDLGVDEAWLDERQEAGYIEQCDASAWGWPCDSWPALPENATWEGRRMAAQCDDYFAWLYELDCSWYEQAAADWRVQHNTGP
jgi:hypothetical protein